MMTTITITPELIARLGSLDKRIEFRDQLGRLVGLYFPAEPKYVNPIDGSPFTEEEIQRMADQPIEELEGEPLEDILKRLGRS
jgi:hypothetical protein